MFDAGNDDALHIYLNLSASHATPFGSVVSSTSNKLGLAPPPMSADLKLEMVLFSLVLAIFLNPPVVI
jgi:hypothetical protein